MTRQSLTVAVVGATGVVGRTMIQVLLEREFPVGELRLLASERSAGRTVSIDGQTHEIGRRPPRPSRASTSPCSRPAPTPRASSRPPAAAAARRSSTTRRRGAWTRRSRSSSAQVNPDDLEGHPGIIANPNCSTMQLVPVLMALRDAVGLERVVVDTYQAVSGTGGEAIRELEGQVRAHVAGEPKDASVYPHQIAFNALPQVDVFLDNGYTKEEWKVVTESRKILHLPDLRDLVHGRPRAGLRRPLRGRPRRDARADHARTGPASCSPRCPASSSRTTRRPRPTRSRPTPPGRTRSTSAASARTRRSTAIAASRSGSCQRQPPQGRRDERRPDRRGRSSSAAGSAPRAARGAAPYRRGARDRRSGPQRDPRRAPGGARGDRGRGPRLHPLPARTRRGRTPCRARAAPTPRSSSSARAPASTRTARAGRSSGAPATCSSKLLGSIELAARRGLHHERRQVPPARQPRPGARRDRGLRAVPPAPARGPRPGPRRDPRPALDGPVHAGRADLAGPRHDPAGRSGDRAPRRDRSSRCTTRRPRSARRTSSARATRTSRCIPAALLEARDPARRAARQPARRGDGRGRRRPAAIVDPRGVVGRRPTPMAADLTIRSDVDARPEPRPTSPDGRTQTIPSGSSRSAASARSARTCTCSSTATTSSSSTAA